MLKHLAIVVLLCAPAVAQKLHVKVARHSVDGVPFTAYLPGFGMNNGNATAAGTSTTASATSSGSSVYLPAHTVSGVLAHIEMTLMLPDGRSVEVTCDDHFGKFAQSRRYNCKNPIADELDADFSGDKVKLTWGVGLDGKKKESETYFVGKVMPTPLTSPQKP